MRRSLTLALSLLAAAAVDCGRAADPRASTASDAAPPVTDTPPVHLLTQQTSAYREEAELVVRDAASWRDAWRALHGGAAETEAPPIDFAREMVILVALGERDTGGFGVRVDAIVTEGAGAAVRYTATSPGPACMTTQSITAPVDVVRVPRAAGAIRFERRSVRTAC